MTAMVVPFGTRGRKAPVSRRAGDDPTLWEALAAKAERDFMPLPHPKMRPDVAIMVLDSRSREIERHLFSDGHPDYPDDIVNRLYDLAHDCWRAMADLPASTPEAMVAKLNAATREFVGHDYEVRMLETLEADILRLKGRIGDMPS